MFHSLTFFSDRWSCTLDPSAPGVQACNALAPCPSGWWFPTRASEGEAASRKGLSGTKVGISTAQQLMPSGELTKLWKIYHKYINWWINMNQLESWSFSRATWNYQRAQRVMIPGKAEPELPTIYKAYVRRYIPQIWFYMVQYLYTVPLFGVRNAHWYLTSQNEDLVSRNGDLTITIFGYTYMDTYGYIYVKTVKIHMVLYG